MKEEILLLIAEKEPQIPKERIEEIYDDMEDSIKTAIQFAFRAWNEGIEKRSVDQRFEKGGWKKYIQDPTECIDHMLSHLINVVNNNREEEHLAHLISRCFMLSYGGLFPEYKGTSNPVVLSNDEEPDSLNEVEGDSPSETSHDGE